MDISNHYIENETIEPNKDLERKVYVKNYNTNYYKTHKKDILEQKKQVRRQKIQDEREAEIKLWKERILNSENPFTLTFEKP
jgi:hypothetical protein